MMNDPNGLESTVLPSVRVTRAYSGTIVYPPGGQFGPRIQSDLQLVLLHSGSMQIRIDDESHAFMPGTVVLLKPGHLESFVFASAEETWHRWIAVGIEPLTLESADFFERLPLSQPISDAMNRITDLMLSCKPVNGTDDPFICSLGHSALLLYEYESRLNHTAQSMHPAVLLAKKTIEDRCTEDWTLAGLASAAQVTGEHLIRLFRRHEGTTPIRYLWDCRIRRGIGLLRGTGLAIGEVAERCGFKTSYHFARMIKQVTGSSPSELRSAFWKGTVR